MNSAGYAGVKEPADAWEKDDGRPWLSGVTGAVPLVVDEMCRKVVAFAGLVAWASAIAWLQCPRPGFAVAVLAQAQY